MANHIQILPIHNSSSRGTPDPTDSIENGSFEKYFKSWNTIGDTSIETRHLGIFPTDGKHQALITTGYSDAGGSVTDSDLEEFLDLAPGSLDKLAGNHAFAFEGSVIKQTFDLKAGDVVSFDWNFLTNEATPDPTFNDTAFLSVNGFTFELADTRSHFVNAHKVHDFKEQTGTKTLRFSVAKAGTYTMGFGVVDVGDANVDSGLVIDDVVVHSPGPGSPEPNLSFGEGGFTSADSTLTPDPRPGLHLGNNGFEIVQY